MISDEHIWGLMLSRCSVLVEPPTVVVLLPRCGLSQSLKTCTHCFTSTSCQLWVILMIKNGDLYTPTLHPAIDGNIVP